MSHPPPPVISVQPDNEDLYPASLMPTPPLGNKELRFVVFLACTDRRSNEQREVLVVRVKLEGYYVFSGLPISE